MPRRPPRATDSPRGPRGRALAVLAVALAPLVGCLAPRESLPVRYFSLAGAEAIGAPPTEPAAEAPRVRLRRFRPSAHLDARMVWRLSGVEIGYREQERWAEPPEVVAERRLARELFEVRGLRRSGSGVTLEGELLAFEELLGPPRRVRVAVAARLADAGGLARMEATFEATRELTGGDAATVAAALGDALDEVLAELADAVEGSLR